MLPSSLCLGHCLSVLTLSLAQAHRALACPTSRSSRARSNPTFRGLRTIERDDLISANQVEPLLDTLSKSGLGRARSRSDSGRRAHRGGSAGQALADQGGQEVHAAIGPLSAGVRSPGSPDTAVRRPADFGSAHRRTRRVQADRLPHDHLRRQEHGEDAQRGAARRQVQSDDGAASTRRSSCSHG